MASKLTFAVSSIVDFMRQRNERLAHSGIAPEMTDRYGRGFPVRLHIEDELAPAREVNASIAPDYFHVFNVNEWPAKEKR